MMFIQASMPASERRWNFLKSLDAAYRSIWPSVYSGLGIWGTTVEALTKGQAFATFANSLHTVTSNSWPLLLIALGPIWRYIGRAQASGAISQASQTDNPVPIATVVTKGASAAAVSQDAKVASGGTPPP